MDLVRYIEASDRVVVSTKIEGDRVHVFCVEFKRKSRPVVRVEPGNSTLVTVLRELHEIASRHNQGLGLKWRRQTQIAGDGIYIYFEMVYAHYTTPLESAIYLCDLVRASRDHYNEQIDLNF